MPTDSPSWEDTKEMAPPAWEETDPLMEGFGQKATAAALGVGAGIYKGVAGAAKAFGALLEGTPSGTVPGIPQGLEEEYSRRNKRTPAQVAQEISADPVYQAGEKLQKSAEAAIPRSIQEQQYWLARGGEQAGSMVGYAAAGPAAPALMGAESFADHIVGDYEEGKKKGLSEDEAGRTALNKALASGGLQAAAFEFLPKPLRKAGEKLILDRFGAGGLSQFLGKRATSAATTAGLFEASHAGENIVSGRPVTEGAGEILTGGSIFGLLSPYGASQKDVQGKAESKPRPSATPDERMSRYEQVKQKVAESGRQLNFLPGDIPGRPNDVALAQEDGTISVSRPKLDHYLEQYIDEGMPIDKAIDRLVTEEITHAAAYDIPEAKEEAAKYWNNYSAVEKKAMRRIVMGERPTDPAAAAAWDARAKSDSYLGLESSRYWMQRMSDLGPTEMSALKRQGPVAVKAMDSLLGFTRKLREKLGTKASKAQQEYFDSVEKNATEAKKGAQDASSVTSPEGVPKPEEGAQVGEKAQLRQQGEAAPAQEGVGQEAQVSLNEYQAKRLASIKAKEAKGQKLSSIEQNLKKAYEAKMAGPAKPEAPAEHEMAGKSVDELISAKPEDVLRWRKQGDAKGNSAFIEAQKSIGAKITPEEAAKLKQEAARARKEATDAIANLDRADTPEAKQKAMEEFNKAQLASLKAQTLDEIADYSTGAKKDLGARTPPKTKAPPQQTGGKNQYSSKLFAARNDVQALESAAAQDPSIKPKLEQARARLDQVQKLFDIAQRRTPPVSAQGAPPSAPEAGAAKPTEPVKQTVARPAIRQATSDIEIGQGPDEAQWREHDEQMRRKLQRGDRMNREDRMLNRELFKRAMKENPSLATEGSGVTMKGSGSTDPEEISKSLGLKYRGTMESANRSVDQYVYDQPGPEGTPSGITVTVPKGTPMEGVQTKMNERLAEYGIAPEGAGVTMKGRSVPPYTEDEALAISKGIFPGMPPGALGPMVKAIAAMKPEEQDSFINHLRQKAEEKIAAEQASEFERQQAILKQQYEQENKELSRRADIQERVESGTQRRLPISPQMMARLKLSLHSYFSGAIEPMVETSQLSPTSVEPMAGGGSKSKLPTAKGKTVVNKFGLEEPGDSGLKIRYSIPKPTDWLDSIRNPAEGPSDPDIIQASDRQLLAIYDEEWGNYLRHAPAEAMEKLRTAHRLDRTDLRGTIPEPELDPLLRILQNIKHGEMEPEKIEEMAKTADIDTTQAGWKEKLLDSLRTRIQDRLPDMALAKGIDITEPGWEQKLFKGLLSQERKMGKARAGYIEAAQTKDQLIKLVREFNDAANAAQRRRSRLTRMLMQRGSSEMFIARKNPARSRLTAEDIQWMNKRSDVGPYAQFARIADIDTDAIDWLVEGIKIGGNKERVDTPKDLAEFNQMLVEGNGGKGANATKRVTLLYDTKTGNLEAVSTYQHDRSKKAMIYDPTGEPGRRDRDHLRIPQLPKRYQIFGSMLLQDPVGYFHQRWTSDAKGSGLKKFWTDIGEMANVAAEGDKVRQRVRKARVERGQKESSAALEQRMALTEREQRAQEELDKLEQQETDAAHEDSKQALEDEGKEQQDPEEFTVKELSDYSRRLSRISEFTQAEDVEDIGPKVNKMDEAALREWEAHNARGLMGLAEGGLLGKNVTPTEARELSNLFYRFNIDTSTRASFRKGMEQTLEYIHDTLADKVSGRDYSMLSAIKKIAARKYQQLLQGEGLLEELREFAAERKQTIAGASKEFYKQKQQKAYEYALEDIRSIHSTVREAFPEGTSGLAFSHELADRVSEAFGDHTPRYIEALSASPQRAAERAVGQLTKAGRLGEVKLPDWTISREPSIAKARQKWLKTPEGQSWLRSPEGQEFLKSAGASKIAAMNISSRLSGEKALTRELSRKEMPKIPAGELPEPTETKWPKEAPQDKLPPEGEKYVREQAQKTGRAPQPGVVGIQLSARTDAHTIATELGDLEKKVKIPGVPKEEWPTARKWLASQEGKRFLLERFGIRQKPEEKMEALHDRLMQKMAVAVTVEERMRGPEKPGEGPWQKVDPDIEMQRAEPGLTMKHHVSGRQRRDEQSKALGLPATAKPEDSRTIEELVAQGEDIHLAGGPNSNPYQVRERFNRTGQISTEDASLLLWQDRELQRDADQATKDFGKGSPEADAAEKDWLEWRDWEQNMSGKTASELMRVRQGVQDLDTGSWAAMKQELKRATKGKQTPEEESILEGLVGEQSETDEGIKETEQKLKQARATLKQENDWEMGVGPEQKAVVKSGIDFIEEFVKQSEQGWKRDEGTPMAMKGGKTAPLTPEEKDALIAKGIREMTNLSKDDGLSEAAWRQAMVKKYPNSAPFLAEIWGPAQQLRDKLVSKAIGADKNTEIARKVLTRNRPPPEASKAILQKAVAKNPGMRNISTAEAIHAWNYIDQKYFDKMTMEAKVGDFDTVLTQAAIDLGIPRERLYRALVAKKSMKTLTDDLYKKMDKSMRLRSHILNWIDQKEHPWIVNVAKAAPRVFFMDKIFGHGFVGMITHASDLAFQPWAWKSYFGKEGGWATMYQMARNKDGFHTRILKQIETDPLYRFAKRVGLEVDPYRFQGDYDIGGWYRWLREKTYGRGFDSLKKLRLDLFKTWWGALEPELQTEKHGELIANDINHMTGIVNTRFPEWSNWTFFAPKLAVSHWATLIGDPLKAMAYFTSWNSASPEQRSWSVSQLKHKAAMVGLYYAGLALNQGILQTVGGGKQSINFDDPKKSDFMAFKVAGFNVGVAGPMIQIVRLLADMIHIGMGEQSKLEKTKSREERMGGRLWEYARRKASPFAGAAVDAFTGQDFTGRPLPWSNDQLSRRKRLQGIEQYGWGEYGLQQVAPIPVEEAVKEVWSQMGMNVSTMQKLWKALTVAAPMGLTGARVWEDPNAEQETEPSSEAVKGPASSY